MARRFLKSSLCGMNLRSTSARSACSLCKKTSASNMKAHPETTTGHVHLTVADLERSLAFYRDVLGFEVTARYGDSAVFLSAGGYHHHIGLNTWAGVGVTPPPKGHSGLY